MPALNVSVLCGLVITSVHGNTWQLESRWYSRTVSQVSLSLDVSPSQLIEDTSIDCIYKADVGGFFGNPEPEMLVRWYQVGIFSPFLRAHAHIDTKRREPFLLDEPYKSIVRDTLRLRYAMLPVWYTAFREASVRGIPVVRPHYTVFPGDENGFALDDQFFIGASGLLVKPVTEKGATEVSVYLPAEEQVCLSLPFNSA